MNWDVNNQDNVGTDTLKELNGLTDKLFELDLAKKDLESQKKKINEQMTIIENQIYAMLEKNDLTKFVGNKCQVFFKHQTSARLVDKEVFKRAVGEDVWDALASINSNTMNAWFKTQKEKAEDAGDYEFQIDGIEYKEFTKIAKRKV